MTVLQHREGLYRERYDDYKIYFVGIPFEWSTVLVDGVQLSIEIDDNGEKYVVVDNDFKKLTLE